MLFLFSLFFVNSLYIYRCFALCRHYRYYYYYHNLLLAEIKELRVKTHCVLRTTSVSTTLCFAIDQKHALQLSEQLTL